MISIETPRLINVIQLSILCAMLRNNEPRDDVLLLFPKRENPFLDDPGARDIVLISTGLCDSFRNQKNVHIGEGGRWVVEGSILGSWNICSAGDSLGKFMCSDSSEKCCKNNYCPFSY